VSTTGWPSDAPILDKGFDRSKDQPEPQNACFLLKTQMLAKRLRSFGFCGMCTVEEEMICDGAFRSPPRAVCIHARHAAVCRVLVHRFKPKFEDCRSSRARRFSSFACSRSSQPFCLCHVNGRYSMSLLHADPSRSRCKPQSRSVQMQIGFCEFRQRFALPRGGSLLVFTLLCVAFRLVSSNFTFTFRVARTSADSAVSARKTHVPAGPRGL
jgi:hypothetical protein